VDREELAAGEEFVKLCHEQVNNGIDVRVLVPSRVVDMRPEFRDYVLFDDNISYEVQPYISTKAENHDPRISSTILTTKEQQVRDLIDNYARLWEVAASSWAPQLTVQAPSAVDPRLDQGSPAAVSLP
jgi:hypothetical protein